KLFMQGFGGNLSKAYLKANMLAGEAVSNIRTVAAFCAEEKIIGLYADELVEPSKRSFRRGQIAGIFYGISQFFIFSSYGIALWSVQCPTLADTDTCGTSNNSFFLDYYRCRHVSVYEVLTHAGHDTVSLLPIFPSQSLFDSFLCFGTYIYTPFTALAMGETLALAPDLLKGNQMVSSIFDMIDRKSGIMYNVGEELMTVEGTIELRRINFSYPSRPNIVIFNDFNLIVPSGKSLALVGQSGSGKSSIISLILRFYDPTSGKVMIDGCGYTANFDTADEIVAAAIAVAINVGYM
ncbi:ABC transporter B family member, partial [Trifolium medium]|nr:ABC transporter B family member [Trifolium medium]